MASQAGPSPPCTPQPKAPCRCLEQFVDTIAIVESQMGIRPDRSGLRDSSTLPSTATDHVTDHRIRRRGWSQDDQSQDEQEMASASNDRSEILPRLTRTVPYCIYHLVDLPKLKMRREKAYLPGGGRVRHLATATSYIRHLATTIPL